MNKADKIKQLTKLVDNKDKERYKLDQQLEKDRYLLEVYAGICFDLASAIDHHDSKKIAKLCDKLPTKQQISAALNVYGQTSKAYNKACVEHEKLCNKFDKLAE